MHTPEQARELWCPMVRGLAADDPIKCLCIADKCAMWRFAAGSGPTEMRTAPSMIEGGEPFQYPHTPKVKTDYGFCGLAGRPEIF